MSPLWTLLSMTLVTLLVVLALGGARALACGRDQPRTTITPAEWDPVTLHRPPEYRTIIQGNPILAGTYRNDITVFCSSSDASNLTILDAQDPGNLQALQAKRLNSTTIQVILNKPDVGNYGYYCTDSITTCTDALYIDVRPAMSVTAPEIHHTLNNYGIPLYFVPHGQAYSVFCSAQTTDLSISWGDLELESKPLNATTVMATVADHTEGERKYFCGSFIYSLAEIWIKVDFYPEAREFQCVLHQKVDCSWKSSSKGTTFKLFVMLMYNQKSRFICLDKSGALTAGCADVFDDEWNSLLMHYHDLSFQLEACNSVFCSNQTFHINIRSSTKADPVYNLKLTNVSSQGASVEWSQDIMDFYTEYKVEYRLLGTDWRPVNVSAVRCRYSDICGLQLALPCPDTHYELRVYMRYKEATDGIYWSEPASIYFFTVPSTGEVDPACDADFRDVTEKPPLSATFLLYHVRELISDERKEKKVLKAKIEALREKLAMVKALMALRTAASDVSASGSVP